MAGTLSAIHVHPVKSCRRIELDRVTVTSTGLAHDRVWQVVDAGGTCVTQRQHRELATVVTALEGDTVLLSVEGHGTTTLTREGAAPTTVDSLLGIPVASVDGGDEAANWISDLLGERCRFAAITDDSDYRLPLFASMWDQPIGFADAAPVLVANTASLDWLNQRSSEPFGIERFRPNLVVDAGDPWVEDTWDQLTIGSASLSVGVPWPRCAIPQIDQQTGTRGAEPAKVLRAHRWCDDAAAAGPKLRKMLEGNGLFGVACGIGPVGTELRVGDPLEVLSTRAPLVAAPTG
jgi:uncharacterized protein YcbX